MSQQYFVLFYICFLMQLHFTMEYGFRVRSIKSDCFSSFDQFFEKFTKKIIAMDLSSSQTDDLCQMASELLNLNKQICMELISKTSNDVEKVLADSCEYACTILKDVDTAYKRSKKIKKSVSYVEPEEKAIGITWSVVKDNASGKISRKMVQSTFHYVPIIQQLKSIFTDDAFCQRYFNYNSTKNHACTAGTYEDYCCGETCREKDFFSSNPEAIMIQLFTDDFEPCDALKSRAGVHKQCAFYFQIRNMPKMLLSRLDNIHLVALCDSRNLKNDYVNLDNILEQIVKEIKILETVGIEVNGKQIKGALVNVSFDNLGGNACFGFSEGFNANYYCRMCDCHKNDCQNMTVEVESKLRNKKDYADMIALIHANKRTDLTQTTGIKKYCILNNLNHFHILENLSVDLMHDVHEGVIPFLLQNLFTHCIDTKIFKIDDIRNMIHFFNYGILNKSNRPSKLKVDKGNLGQSAHQSYCLMVNLPFILLKFKNKLLNVWKPVETLLQIIQILFSDKIIENDLARLTSLIDSHLSSLKNIFKVDLLPKHHFLLHYPTVIRMMGPVIFMWTMRMEAKHHFFKELVRKKKNFINLTKSLSYKHQEMQCVNGINYDDVIVPAKIQTPFVESEDFQEYYNLMTDKISGIMNIEETQTIKSLRFNGTLYKMGLLVAFESKILEIDYILCDPYCKHYWLLCCTEYRVHRMDSFCNSLVLEKIGQNLSIFNLNELNDNNKSYEMIFVKDEIHVKAETLKLFYMAK